MLGSNVIFPTVAVANVTVELAEKYASLPEVQAVPPVAVALPVLQGVPVVQVPEVPLFFQYNVCPHTPFTPSIITKAKALRYLKMGNLLLVEVGFLNVFIVLPLVAV